jgi:hypothetical protein
MVMSILRNSLLILLALASQAHALQVQALNEWFRPDPFGGIVQSDHSGAEWLSNVAVSSARGSHISFQVVAKDIKAEQCRLQVRLPLQAEIYREWFHFNTPDRHYYPDALIPVKVPYQFAVDSDSNHVQDQTAAAFWVDVWIPPSAEPKPYAGEVTVVSGTVQKTVPIHIDVLAATVPNEDAITLDNNSYGTSWLVAQYPQTLKGLPESSDGKINPAEDRLLDLIHDYHRLFYDHRGTFHQLGYGHAGKVGPEFAPALTGTGKGKRIASWELFDRHYGPLLDGSAFQSSPRGAQPIPSVYLPVNPEWPASFLWWGEPGYEAEFVPVLSEMERHFHEKGWTHTRFELFFNHKKRYKGFHSDGDEIRFERDNADLLTYRRLLDRAVPHNTPVQFAMRADTSWTMASQFKQLEGVINFWVASEGVLSWQTESIASLKHHGDTVWDYGGTPTVQETSSAMALNPLRSWIWGVDGFVRWLTVDPGADPWFHLAGGDTVLAYSGERFGVSGPIPSIRLKLQRNCLQDLALLKAICQRETCGAIQEQVANLFNHTKVEDWFNRNPALPAVPVLDWNNADIDDALKPYEARFKNLDAAAWLRVHNFALRKATVLQ